MKTKTKPDILLENYSSDEYEGSSAESSELDENLNDLNLYSKQKIDFGIIFDVDGVIARGSTPLTPALEAVELLKDGCNKLRVPIAFVTNACSPRKDKAARLSQWLGVDVDVESVILAPSPCRVLTEFHDSHVLVIGQKNRKQIAHDLGFKNVCFIDQIRDAYPLLDVVNHDNRDAISKGYTEKTFPRVEAILLLGEPTEWESHLQLLIDLILTNGLPNKAPPSPTANGPQLPIIACNMDLQFMAEACMPRFGHGAFLVCLESLYKKITGFDLRYSVLVGKPCELTYRYAEHIISIQARRLGIFRPIKRLYFIGDNDQVDIVGANLYNRYVKMVSANRRRGHDNEEEANERLPESRRLSCGSQLHEQTVEECVSLLVCTGVYDPSAANHDVGALLNHGHRDIENDEELSKPTKLLDNVLDAIKYIFDTEGISSDSSN